MKTILRRTMLLLASLPLAGEALAHADGSLLHTHGLLDGVLHPATGWDHALVALVVGLLVAQRHTKAAQRNAKTWQLPSLFIGGMALAMLAGASLAFGGWVESGIVLSLLAVGLLLLAVPRDEGRAVTFATIGVVIFAGAAHGVVHGVEAGEQPAYLAGVLLGTAILHAAGIALGRMLVTQALLLRGIGFATLATGVGVLVTG